MTEEAQPPEDAPAHLTVRRDGSPRARRMSTFRGEPGDRLGGRYRLEDRLSVRDGWTAWKAADETLARPVTVLALARGFPRIGPVMTAARAASRLTDARLAQVFDIEEDNDHAYLVTEWVTGESLADLLAGGPLDPGLGAMIVAQAAEALAVAHAAAVAHLCLTPGSLHWAPDRGVKITGLGIGAALTGAAVADPALADTWGLGRLLYAALTAHWPGGAWARLPPAPQAHGRPCSPRQVRATVPAGLDEVTRGVLWGPPHTGAAITTPAAMATALSRLIPVPAARGRGGGWPQASRRGAARPAAGDATGPVPPVRVSGALYRPGGNGLAGRGAVGGAAIPAGGPSATRVVAAVAGMVGVVAVLAGMSVLSQRGAGPVADALPSPRPVLSSPVSVLTPRAAAAFGPGGGDNPARAPLAIDGKLATGWVTGSHLRSPHAGHRDGGTGLILDMGTRVSVSSVTVTFGQVPGGHARAEVGDTGAGDATAGFTTLARTGNATGTVTFAGQHPATGRYVLIWFTKLPPERGAPGFQADVFNVIVRGSR